MSNFLGQFATQSQLPAIDSVSVFPNDSAYTLDDGAYWIAKQPSAPPGAQPQWLFIDVLRGGPGPQGPAGAGLPGPQGQIGPPGEHGRTGQQGPAGKNSFSYLSQVFSVPASTANPVSTPVNDSSWMAPGILVFIPGAGTFTCIGTPPNPNTVLLVNSGDPNNSPAGIQIAAGTTISPASQRGPAGPQGSSGPAGPPGPQGVGGASAYSTLASDFTVPSTNGVAFLVSADTFAVGQIVYCGAGNYFSVSAVNPTADTLTLINQHYPGGQTPGTLIPAGSTVSGTGPQGPQGPVGPQGIQGIQGLIGVAPAGAILMWCTSTPPGGWLICNGTQYATSAYPDLFAVIGNDYGGGLGSGLFNVPDMRNRFPVGGSSTIPLTGLGSVGGEDLHTLTINELPSHAHTMGNHTHLGVDHVHSLQNHSHYMDHYHTWLAQGAHQHGLGGHTHGASQPINYNSYQATILGGGYQFLSTLNTGGPQYWSGNTVGPSGPSDAANIPAGNTVYASQTNAAWANTGGPSVASTGTAGGLTTGGPSTNTTSSAGINQAFDNRPPYRAFNFIIKT